MKKTTNPLEDIAARSIRFNMFLVEKAVYEPLKCDLALVRRLHINCDVGLLAFLACFTSV